MCVCAPLCVTICVYVQVHLHAGVSGCLCLQTAKVVFIFRGVFMKAPSRTGIRNSTFTGQFSGCKDCRVLPGSFQERKSMTVCAGEPSLSGTHKWTSQPLSGTLATEITAGFSLL